MDFVVSKRDLLKELQYVQGVVERKTTVPILSNLLLETTSNRLIVTATDLDVTLQCSCAAQVTMSGSVTVVARKLFEIVRLLPEAEIHFKATGEDWIQVTCQRSHFKLATLSKENFPEVAGVAGDVVTLPAAEIRYMINRSIFAITQEESRYTLNGALLLISEGKITLVTTDGHRLVLIRRAGDLDLPSGEVRVLVPRKTLQELAKLAGEGIDSVDFSHTDNHLFFRVGDRLLVSRILTGQFPNYEMVLPKDNDRTLKLSTLDFADALRRVAVMADEQSRAVRFRIGEGQVEISSVSAGFGEANESIPAEFEGDTIEIGFNSQYLLDFLTGLESEEAVIELKDQETQGLFRPASGDDYDYRYVVMPMKL